ncbi:hypothetical protein [Actinokineospora iranica]|uniref:PE family protein n=1 Tax=Actinokineospora iranica TaxID=1271860 RepID=A0A1G6Q2C6_9PSEU|nr:hypothetical protein [Actinokineospora iranica]SDC86391.1 hypothetical protein SAMN05216174_10548 [Actinokineospora iranica]
MTSAFRSSIDASVGHIAGSGVSDMVGGAPPSGDGGKFSFSPDEIRSIVKDWLDLADDYTQSMVGARPLGQVDPPGNDPASHYHAQAVATSSQAYMDSLKEKAEYCYNQAQKFQDALSDYLGVERENVRGLDSTDGSASGPSAPSAPGGI